MTDDTVVKSDVIVNWFHINIQGLQGELCDLKKNT